MSPRLPDSRSMKRAPAITGALFWAVFALAISSCGRKGGTADWDQPGDSTPSVEVSSPSAAVAPPAAVEVAKVADPATEPPANQSPAEESGAASPVSGSGLHFIEYNVENWLVMDRFINNKQVKDSPKPESEKKAVISILAKNQPDVLGLCEIGQASDLAEIQSRLKAAGVDLPHSHHTGGSDPTRHLGILSRFPITSTSKPAETEFQLKGQTFGINRGILDATIEARGKSYRFIGVHLKSKREVEEADQEQLRIHEARLLRRHVDSILATDPEARLVVYGDFNDTRPTTAFKTVTGSYNSPGYLTAIPFKDSRGHAWTHHWAPHDIYSRIDFVCVTRPLRSEVDFRASHIIDDGAWDKASDHRALKAIFR